MKTNTDFKFLIFLILLITSLSSCNLTNHYLKKVNKQYVKLGMTDWLAKNDSSEIYWRKVGHGNENLLLIHGFGPATELQWEDVVKLLYDDFTIYIPDLIYFGKSSSEVANYDPSFITRQLHQSLQTEKIETIYVAGVSFGGLITGVFAHEYTEMTHGIILIDALSKFYTKTHTDSLARKNGYEGIDDILIPEDGSALKTLFQLSYYKPIKYPVWILNNATQQLYSDQREEKENLLDFLRKNESLLKSSNYVYTGKTHIVWGKEDLIIPVSNAYELKAYYPNSELTILQETGHVANMEAPEKIAGIISEMVKNK